MSMPITIRGETYLDTSETCQRLGISRATLVRYFNEGRVRKYRQGIARTVYYKETDVDRLAGFRSDVYPIEDDEEK